MLVRYIKKLDYPSIKKLIGRTINKFKFDRELNPDEINSFLFKNFQIYAEKYPKNTLVCEHFGKIMYALQIEKLEWDSKIFGFGVGKIFNIFLNQEKYVPSAMDFLIKSSIKKLKKMKVNRIICRIPAVDFNTLKILEDNGFRTYENLITFARQLNNIPPLALSKDLEISNFKREDINEILKISYNTPTSSHFFNDPRFPNKKVKKFYREWTRNSCNSFANNVIVCRQNKKVVGFITLKIMTDFSIKYGIIDLVRVKEKYTGLGIGTGLVYAALRWFKDNNMNKVIVGTESTNIPAMRLYENTGFRTIFSEFTLHY